MKDKIRELLFELEVEENVSVIACRSFGSHMMNLDSPDSDYDAFVIFSQDAGKYAEVGGYTDTLNKKHGEIDFQCWNVKKFGELLNVSNPTAMEFLNSPVEYYCNPEFRRYLDALTEMANKQFKPIALYYHYRSMAESNYYKYIKPCLYDDEGNRFPIVEELDEPEHYLVDATQNDKIDKQTAPLTTDAHDIEKGNLDQTVKRNLYIMRAILYARYARETHEMPTMDFQQFVSTLMGGDLGVGGHTLQTLEELIEKKTSGQGHIEIGNPCGAFIESELNYELDAEKHITGDMDTDLINAFINNSVMR